MANGTNNQVRSANACLIVVQNQVIGISQSLRIQADFALQDQSGIGDSVVIEYVPGIAKITVSLSGVFLIAQNLASVGIVPSQSVRDVLQGNVFDVGVYSSIAGTNTPGNLLVKAISCSPSSMSYSVDTGQSLKYDHQFACLDLAGSLLG
jgi:hypothetical protein